MDGKELFRRLVDEAPNKGNLDVIDEVLHEDVVFYIAIAPEPVRGREAMKATIGGFREAFPDLSVRIDEISGEGDRVAALVTVSGTNTGELMGQPATGKKATWQVAHFLRIADGQIIEDKQATDRLGIFEQLGLAPAPA